MIRFNNLKGLMILVGFFVIMSFVATSCKGGKGSDQDTPTPKPVETDNPTPEPPTPEPPTDAPPTDAPPTNAPPEDCSNGCQSDGGPYTMNFDSSQMVDGVLECTYTVTVDDAYCCNVNRATITGGDPQPDNSAVSLSRENSGADFIPTPTGEVEDGWSTTTNAAGCSVLGCGNGDYTVTINSSGDECPSDILMELLVL